MRSGLANMWRLVFFAALRNWRRNLSTTAPALGSLGLLLLVAGVLATLGAALENVVRLESADASVLHVYLSDQASSESITALTSSLATDPAVASVTYVSQDQALVRAKQRPVLKSLIDSDPASPFPAELDVAVHSVDAVASVAASVQGVPAVDPAFPSSYDGVTYSRLRHFLTYVQVGAGALLSLLAMIAIAVSSNAIRAAILARRDEVSIMWLVGSPAWVVKLPFMLEGALTGVVAGAVSASVIVATWVFLERSATIMVLQVLPGVDLALVLRIALTLPMLGALVGSASSLLGLRRLSE